MYIYNDMWSNSPVSFIRNALQSDILTHLKGKHNLISL